MTVDGDTFQLTESGSAFIPIGAKHRLENEGETPLHLIEVQCGRGVSLVCIDSSGFVH